MFELSSYLTARQALIEEELVRRLPAADQRPATLHQAMRYAVLDGGKRVRPILCLAAAEACGGDPARALIPATALEIFHAYTLVHDDLPSMDDDDLRRGKPTCHKVYGEANAILAGDALLTLAFEWLATHPPPAPYDHADYVRELSQAGGHAGVIAGQVEDLAGEEKEATADDVVFIHSHKTGALIRAAARMGAMAAGVAPGVLDLVSRYGEAIGLAFQVADDLLNETSDAATIGKAAGSDVARGKTTYVSVYGIEEARRQADELLQTALASLRDLPGDTRPLEALAQFIVHRAQ